MSDESQAIELSGKQRAFLAAFRETGNVRRAADTAEVGRQTVYDWKDRSSDFKKAMDDAAEDAADLLEEEARRRAEAGVRRLRFNPKTGEPYIDPKTGEAYVEHEYSDQLAMFLLRGLRPEKYSEKFRHEHAGNLTTVTRVVFQKRPDAVEIEATEAPALEGTAE